MKFLVYIFVVGRGQGKEVERLLLIGAKEYDIIISFTGSTDRAA